MRRALGNLLNPQFLLEPELEVRASYFFRLCLPRISEVPDNLKHHPNGPRPVLTVNQMSDHISKAGSGRRLLGSRPRDSGAKLNTLPLIKVGTT